MYSDARLRGFQGWMDAALGEGDWLQPLKLSAELLGARAAAILWTEASSGTVKLKASPEAAPVFFRLCRELGACAGEGVLTRDKPGLGRILWLNVRDQSGWEVAFFALFDGGGDGDLLSEIASTAARCVSARARMNTMSATSALKTAAFDQLPFGVVIVDKEIRIAERNDAGRALLARADGVTVLRDKLACREPNDQAALQAAVCLTIAGEADAGIVKIHRVRGAEPYVVRVVGAGADAGARDHCLLMIVDPDEEASPGGDIWRAMFDLTECELIIAEGLVSGRRINDIALQRGVSVETVQTQTKRMFERLNVSSQAEAAARLSRTAPFRSPATQLAEVV